MKRPHTTTREYPCSPQLEKSPLSDGDPAQLKIKLLSRVRLFVTPWTVHGIFQARILEWVAFPFRGSSQRRDQTQVSRAAGGFFTS